MAISMQMSRAGMPIVMSGWASLGEALIAPEELRKDRII